jgi:hypothetical protein
MAFLHLIGRFCIFNNARRHIDAVTKVEELVYHSDMRTCQICHSIQHWCSSLPIVQHKIAGSDQLFYVVPLNEVSQI